MPEDSGNCSAMFAAIVDGFVAADQVERDGAGGHRQHQGDREGLAEGAAEAQHGAADDAGPAVGQHRQADHLPAGGAEGERGLAVQRGHLAEDLAGDGADDRQDHDGEHEPRGEHRAAGGRRRAREERDEAQVLLGPLVEGHQPRRQPEDAPEAVDDAGDRRQQVDDVAERLGQAAWGEVGQEQSDGDAPAAWRRPARWPRPAPCRTAADRCRRRGPRRRARPAASAVSAGIESTTRKTATPARMTQDGDAGPARAPGEQPIAEPARGPGRRLRRVRVRGASPLLRPSVGSGCCFAGAARALSRAARRPGASEDVRAAGRGSTSSRRR